MFARISKYQLKPGTLDAAEALMNSLKPRIMALPGMQEFLNAVDDDGNGYVVSIVDSQETSEANQSAVAAIWAEFADFLAGPPQISGHRVLVHERN